MARIYLMATCWIAQSSREWSGRPRTRSVVLRRGVTAREDYLTGEDLRRTPG
jgi:hypothetical protein